MKKFLKLSLVFSVLALIFVNCSRDDEKSSPTLVGTWQLVELSDNGKSLLDNCSGKGTVVFTQTEVTLNEYFYNNNGKCHLEVLSGTYKADKDALTYYFSNSRYYKHSYQFEGNDKLELRIDSRIYTYNRKN